MWIVILSYELKLFSFFFQTQNYFIQLRKNSRICNVRNSQ